MEADIEFIQTDLLPEMVHNRCFCEKDSREFVEFESAVIEALEIDSSQLNCNVYRADVVVSFSGEPKVFHVLVKLLSESDANFALGFDGFLNEEILCNKGRLQYGNDFFPYYYVADMGRYGRPVIVIEDLEKIGFHQVLDRDLNREEGLAIVDLIGRFHAKGFLLKDTKFPVFREFYAKFQDIVLAETNEENNRAKYTEFSEKIKSTLTEAETFFHDDSYAHCKDSILKSTTAESSTICQGFVVRENLWFKRSQDKLEVKVLDWHRVRHGSNSLDLATILTQCQVQHWTELTEAYIAVVQKEYSTAPIKDLRKDLSDFGFHYACLLLARNKEQSIDFKRVMNYISE